MINGYKQNTSVFFLISAPAFRPKIDPSPALCSPGPPPPCPPCSTCLPPLRLKTWVKTDKLTHIGLISVAQFEEAASAHVQKLNFPYGNSDCAVCQTVVTPQNFPYSILCQSLSISIISSIFSPFKLLFISCIF